MVFVFPLLLILIKKKKLYAVRFFSVSPRQGRSCIFVWPSVIWQKHFSGSRCSAQYCSFSQFNGCEVKQMQPWCFIKIHLCTTSHYTSATAKDIQKHFTEDVESAPGTAQQCFPFFLTLLFCCSEAFLWLLWWWRNVTLVCDYLYEVCIRFPPTWVIAFFVFLLPPFFSFLIKLTNNKRAGADRKSMQLGQPWGLRRGPDTDAFYALDDEAKWAPSHGRQVKQKSLWTIGSEIQCRSTDSHHCAILVVRQKTDAI